METKPVCIGEPPKWPPHKPTPMYRSGSTPPPQRLPRWKCPECGRTVSGSNADKLLTAVSPLSEVMRPPRIKKQRKHRSANRFTWGF